jgi:poly(3-hydroxybutyrate) depolymerase
MKATTILIVLLLGAASGMSASTALTAITAATTTATTTTLSSSLNPSVYGQAVIFTAAVATAEGPLPASTNGESVTFQQGAKVLGTGTLSDGSATFTISTLTTGGTDNIKAVYPGDSTFAKSTSNTVGQVVDKAATTTTVVSLQNPSNLGQSVTFTASVAPQYSGTVTGSVAFYDGSTKLGTASLSGGVASYPATTLPLGTDSITAVFNGSTSFTTSTSSPVSQAVENGTFIDSTMTYDGITRYYQVYLPAVLPSNPPMVLMLHGTKYNVPPSNPSTLSWGWQSVADEYGFILVQPASTWNPVTGQWNWNSYFMSAAFSPSDIGTCTVPPATACPDDAGFLRMLINNLVSQYKVNPNAVYVTGMSSGAQMAERVGVELSDLVAAIAPASGQMEGQQAAPPPVETPGAAAAPVSVQEWHGTLDTELPPCNYGTTVYSAVTYYLDTVDDTFNYWATQNSCTTLQTTQPLCLNDAPDNANDAPTPGMTGKTGNIATGCKDDVEVQFIWEPNVGHSYQAQNNTARWLFFAAHPKPAAESSRAR